MTAPMSAERLTEMAYRVRGHRFAAVQAGERPDDWTGDLDEAVDEIERLRAEPQAWHSGTLGYVTVRIGKEPSVWAGIQAGYWLYPTREAAQEDCPPGWQVAPVFPMSVIEP